MSENTEKIIRYALSGDKDKARESFKAAIKEKIVEKIEQANAN